MVREIEKNKKHYDFINQYLLLPEYEVYLTKDHWRQLGYYSHSGRLVGSIIFAVQPTRTLILYTVVTLDWRGTGINKQLATAVERISAELNKTRVSVNIRQTNTASLISFLKSGYLISRSTDSYNNGEKKISLVKQLKYVQQAEKSSTQEMQDL